MKSLSLDSPESTELHGQMRRRYPRKCFDESLKRKISDEILHITAGTGPSAYYGGSGGGIDHSTPPSNNSKNNSRLHCKSFHSSYSIETSRYEINDFYSTVKSFATAEEAFIRR